MSKSKGSARDTDKSPSKTGEVAKQPRDRKIYLMLNRVINAPIEVVYAAWTDPAMLRRWLAPGNATVVGAVAEVSVGGTFLVEMRTPDGKSWLTRGVYQEVVPLRRLVHTWRWEGSDIETLVTVEFEPESDSRTRLTLTHSRFARDEARDEHEQGWVRCLAKLEDLWPK